MKSRSPASHPVEVDQIMVDFENDNSSPADDVDEGLLTLPRQAGREMCGSWAHTRLLCGDTRDLEGLKCLMGGERAAMAFLDPPFNVRIKDVVGRGSVQHAEFAMGSGEMSRKVIHRFSEGDARRYEHQCHATVQCILCAWTGGTLVN